MCKDDLVETKVYRNHIIEIWRDERKLNPFSDWDCEPDLITRCMHGIDHYGNTDPDECPVLTEKQIIDNLPGIKRLLDFKPEDSLIRVLKFHDCWFNGYDRDNSVVDKVNRVLEEYFDSIYGENRLFMLEQLLNYQGIVTFRAMNYGCTQGDWYEYLLVASKEFLDRTGAVIEKKQDLTSSARLFEAWHNGDIFSYIVKDHTGEIIDSCHGFYGYDHEQSGLMEYAQESINNNIAAGNEVLLSASFNFSYENPPITFFNNGGAA